jgi:hypothetical protein
VHGAEIVDVLDDRVRAGGNLRRNILSLAFFPMIGYTVLNGQRSPWPSPQWEVQTWLANALLSASVNGAPDRERRSTPIRWRFDDMRASRTNPAAQEFKRTQRSEWTRQRERSTGANERSGCPNPRSERIQGAA